MDGVCTLANDYVYDQLIALLNSIEAIMGEIPVCIYPYDQNTEKIAAEIAQRPQVQLYGDRDLMAEWDDFCSRAWELRQHWLVGGNAGPHRPGRYRRLCAFDGPFDRFIYMDADTLLMKSLEGVFAYLDSHDCVVYDFQHKDPGHIYELSSPKLTQVFPQERIDREIFCSGFFGSKTGLFNQEKREWLLACLESGEAEIVYSRGANDQPLLNYMFMKSNYSVANLAFELPKEQVTGCCVTSSHFEVKDQILYDKGVPLTYIHYIGLAASLFNSLCQGENIDFPYRDLFLHYRYRHEPQQQPQFSGKPKPYNAPPSLMARALKKLGLK